MHHHNIKIGTDEYGRPVYLPLERLFTHVHVLGPPGSGKTMLLLHIFQSLSTIKGATIFMMTAKGALCRHALAWCIANGYAQRTVWFDPGSEPVIGYDPMYPTAVSPATHAKAVREAIRASWGQSSFDATPQLARFLFLVLSVARALELSLDSCIAMLRTGESGSRLRRACAEQLSDPFLRDMILSFDALPDRRQEELAASTLARLEPFICDPAIRRMLTATPSFNVAEAIAGYHIVLINLEIGRPLRLDDVRLLGRFVVNDIVNQAFICGSQSRPVFLIIDEVQNFITVDLCTVLDEGRELGLCAILGHQYLNQLKGLA